MASILEPSKAVSVPLIHLRSMKLFYSIMNMSCDLLLIVLFIFWCINVLCTSGTIVLVLCILFGWRFVCLLIIVVQSFFPAMTKIVGTLGPRSRSVELISGCLKAGMSGILIIVIFSFPFCIIFWYFLFLRAFGFFVIVARFDFSWGDSEYHQETLENLKAAVKITKKLCAVCDCHLRLSIYVDSAMYLCCHIVGLLIG